MHVECTEVMIQNGTSRFVNVSFGLERSGGES